MAHAEPTPHLIDPRARRPRAIALVLHGGEEHSTTPVKRLEPAFLRMVPFARDLEARSRGRIAAPLLRNAVRGWNDDLRSPIRDAEWALAKVRTAYPNLPIGLIGHSMGGRVALELAGHPDVSSIVALAPWVGERYDGESFVGTPLLVVHGVKDTVTAPELSERLVARVKRAGGEATYVGLSDAHAMLRRAGEWHRLASRFTEQMLLHRVNNVTFGQP
ncbi:alpha/beta hydrolase [Luteipulveratus mongoliensis]|uniref:Serine aminopeptidase S33 domain-containing protein n=1 Tax=Luteipulveratus mongoliensis TaxID=571913 RepID=A0A0K1JNN6_9MICO|nr:alpha/beta fold hydrolase [Luteipulveratus mongoliensis]AKU18321.1 hypothetical protein VV02_24880 [Luteipulveratus mongoliensis]